jgi:riboflavin biosynthesis pyrimidine reductase
LAPVPPVFKRLLPDLADVDAGEQLSSLRDELRPLAERPATLANFAVTADGRVAFGGRSGALGDDGDRALFHELRGRVDAVLAGIGTLRAERYGRMIAAPERRAARVAAGLAPEPLACVISRSGRNLPLEVPLFAEPEARIVLFSPVAPELAGVRAQVEVITLDSQAEPLGAALRVLRNDYAVRSLLCEGGPTIFAALLHEGLVDELFLTLTPKLAGGDSGPALTAGPPLAELQQMRIAWLLARNQSLYLRYQLVGEDRR